MKTVKYQTKGVFPNLISHFKKERERERETHSANMSFKTKAQPDVIKYKYL